MRPSPEAYRLSFLMPEGADLDRACFHYRSEICALEVHGAGLVVLAAPSREALLDCAGEFLVTACAGLSPRSIAVRLRGPGAPVADAWTAIVGANVAFCPTGLGAHLSGARGPPRARAAAEEGDGQSGEVGDDGERAADDGH